MPEFQKFLLIFCGTPNGDPLKSIAVGPGAVPLVSFKNVKNFKIKIDTLIKTEQKVILRDILIQVIDKYGRKN